MKEEKIIYELRLSKPILIFLWVMGVSVVLNLPLGKTLIPDAMAELASNPTIHIVLSEEGPYQSRRNFDIDD